MMIEGFGKGFGLQGFRVQVSGFRARLVEISCLLILGFFWEYFKGWFLGFKSADSEARVLNLSRITLDVVCTEDPNP